MWIIRSICRNVPSTVLYYHIDAIKIYESDVSFFFKGVWLQIKLCIWAWSHLWIVSRNDIFKVTVHSTMKHLAIIYSTSSQQLKQKDIFYASRCSFIYNESRWWPKAVELQNISTIHVIPHPYDFKSFVAIWQPCVR